MKLSKTKIFIAIVLLVALTLLIFRDHRSNINIAPHAQLETGQTYWAHGLTEGGWPETIVDHREIYYWYGWVKDNYQNRIVFTWGEGFNSENIVLSFGEEHIASDFDVSYSTYENPEGLVKVHEVRNNKDPRVQLNLTAQNIDTLKIDLQKTNAEEELILVREVYVNGSISILSLFTTGLKQYSVLSLLVLLGVILFVIPGLVISKYLIPKRIRSANIMLATSFFFSTITILATTAFALALGREKILYLLPLLFVVSLYLFFKKRLYRIFKQADGIMIKSFFLALFFFISYQIVRALQEGYIFQADYLVPYSFAKIMLNNFGYMRIIQAGELLNRENYYFLRTMESTNLMWGWHGTDRPPLIAVVMVAIATLYKDKMIVFQTWNILLSTMFVPALYLLGKNLFDKHVAKYTVLLAPLIPVVIFETLNRPNRILAVYFVLLMVFSVVNKKWFDSEKPSVHFFRGFFAGMAHLAHSSSLIYISGTLLYLLLKRKFRAFLLMIPSMLLLMLPWTIWSRIVDRSSPFFYYPVMVRHWSQTNDLEEIIPIFKETPISIILGNRWDNFLSLFLHDIRSETTHNYFFADFTNYQHSFFTLPYALSLPIFILAVIYIYKQFFDGRWKLMLSIIIAPIAAHIFFVLGWYDPRDTTNPLQSAIVLIFLLGIGQLFNLKRNLKIPVYLYLFIKHLWVIWLSYLGIEIFFSGKGDIRTLIPLAVIIFIYFVVSKNIFEVSRLPNSNE